MLVSFLSVPLTIRYLGPEQYGAWVTIGSVLAWLNLTDFGLGNGLTNAVTTAAGQDRPDLARMHLSNGIFPLTEIVGATGLVALAAWPFIDWAALFGVKGPEAQAELGPAVAAALAIFLLQFPLGMAGKVYLAYQEGRIGSYWGAAGNILSLAVPLIVTQTHGGLLWLVIALPGTSLLVNIASNLWIVRQRQGGLPDPGRAGALAGAGHHRPLPQRRARGPGRAAAVALAGRGCRAWAAPGGCGRPGVPGGPPARPAPSGHARGDRLRPHRLLQRRAAPAGGPPRPARSGAPVPDVAMTAPVHEALRAKGLLPEVHLVDAGYVDADLLVDAKAEHGIELVGPVRPDTSWQAKAGEGYDISAFGVDWGRQSRHLPAGAQERGLGGQPRRLGRRHRACGHRGSDLPRLPQPAPLHPCQESAARADAPARRPARGHPGRARAAGHAGVASAVRRAPESRAACRRACASAGCAARATSDLPRPACSMSRPQPP